MAESGQGAGGLQRIQQPVGPGLVGQITTLLSSFQQRLKAMPVRKRNSLGLSAFFLAAGIAAMVWYAERPDKKMLFSGLDGKDMQQVSQELSGASIPYELTPDGAGILVAAEWLDKARMEVAAKGMPQSGRLGFELFDRPNWVGSEFDERVNYQRALEGELEHTIGTIAAVRSSRVHLVLPQETLFAAERKVAKASVVLKLKRASLDPDQVEAIRSVVAGAVENLSPDNVTLVDADGRTDFKPRSRDTMERDLEQGMETKLVAMLEPLAGRDNVRATVNVTYDQAVEQRTDEVYDPTQVVPLSIQKTDQSTGQPLRPQGIPGTASNSPAGVAAPPVTTSETAAGKATPPLLQKDALPVFPQAAATGQTLHQESASYGVTKHLVSREEGPGRIKRVAVAVLVNDRQLLDAKGGVAWKARSPDEMRRLEQLAHAAVGFDAGRGDQVVIENVGFNSNMPDVKLSLAQRATEEGRAFVTSQPGLLRTVMLGVCGVLVVLLVLRPLTRRVIAILDEPVLLQDGERIRIASGASVAEVKEQEQRLEPIRIQPPQPPPVFEYVSQHIQREPVQSTRLLETWIGSRPSGAQL